MILHYKQQKNIGRAAAAAAATTATTTTTTSTWKDREAHRNKATRNCENKNDSSDNKTSGKGILITCKNRINRYMKRLFDEEHKRMELNKSYQRNEQIYVKSFLCASVYDKRSYSVCCTVAPTSYARRKAKSKYLKK